MNFGAVPMATNWLQNFNQITVSVEMRGINALKAYYKCILLLPVKYMSWSGNKQKNPRNLLFCVIFGDLFCLLSTNNYLFI